MAAVGSTVRALLPKHKKARRRGVVATVQKKHVCILWEDDAPRSISMPTPLVKRGSFLARTFIVAPLFQDEADELEDVILEEDVESLLDFETTHCAEEVPVEEWKNRGDHLLRLGDASASVSYYDHALKLSGPLQVGSSVVIQVDGFAKVADVDCIEDDGGIDVTMAETGLERTIKESDVLLCIRDASLNQLQERVLLNISRCLLQLADTTFVAKRRPKYLRSAVLACTLALTLIDFWEGQDVSFPEGTKTALLLRCQANMCFRSFLFFLYKCILLYC